MTKKTTKSKKLPAIKKLQNSHACKHKQLKAALKRVTSGQAVKQRAFWTLTCVREEWMKLPHSLYQLGLKVYLENFLHKLGLT